jgi:hypothetical protein
MDRVHGVWTGAVVWIGGAAVTHRRVGARGHRCSPMVAGEDEVELVRAHQTTIDGVEAAQWQRKTTSARAQRESRGECERALERGETGAVEAGFGGALL